MKTPSITVYRIKLEATLAEAPASTMQIDDRLRQRDRAAGDFSAEYPTLLEDALPESAPYPREAIIAEKLHAMVILGERNSRYKDFRDVYVQASQFPV